MIQSPRQPQITRKDSHHAEDVKQFFGNRSQEIAHAEQKKQLNQATSASIQRDEYGEQVFSYDTQENTYIAEHPEEVLAYWQGPEYEVYPKSRVWYTTVSIVIALIALYAIWTNSPVMAIVFLLIGAVGFLYINTPPRVLDYAITQDGIVVGDRIYEFDEISSYWIFYEPPHTRIISLRIRDGWFPYVHVPLHQLDPVEVRSLLSQFTQEKRQEKTVIDVIERLLHI